MDIQYFIYFVFFCCLRFDHTLPKFCLGKVNAFILTITKKLEFLHKFNNEWTWIDVLLLADSLGWAWIISRLLILGPNLCLPVTQKLVNINKNPVLLVLTHIFPAQYSAFFPIFHKSLVIWLNISLFLCIS